METNFLIRIVLIPSTTSPACAGSRSLFQHDYLVFKIYACYLKKESIDLNLYGSAHLFIIDVTVKQLSHNEKKQHRIPRYHKLYVSYIIAGKKFCCVMSL